MKLEYATERLEKYITELYDISIKRKQLTTIIGADLTRMLKKRINHLIAAENFSIYLSTGLGKSHRLSGDKEGRYGIHLDANYRLVVRPVVNDENEPDFRKVEIVCVESVEDYHGRGKNNTIVS